MSRQPRAQGEEAGPDAGPEASSRIDQIVSEAAVLFRDKGFAATSMSDLARIVGVSKPALYHHFASTEDVFVAVAMREPQAAADRMLALMEDASLEPQDKLRRLLDLAYDNIVNSTAGQMMHTIAETSSRFPDIARRFRDGFDAGQQTALRRIVDEGIAKGVFRADHAPAMIEMVFGPPIMLSLTHSMYGNLPDSPPLDLYGLKERHYRALIALLG